MLKSFIQSETGAARSSIIFAAAMGITAVAMLATSADYDGREARSLNDLSDTQFLSSQKLR